MKAAYDTRTDTLSIILKGDAAIADSDEDKPGVILDYDADGNLVSLEILDASKRVIDAHRIEFETMVKSVVDEIHPNYRRPATDGRRALPSRPPYTRRNSSP